MGEPLLDALLVFVLATAVLWLLLIVAMSVFKPSRESLRDGMSLLPDLYKLVRKLLVDKSVPRAARWKLWALLAYLAFPIDIIPDFIPVIGFADDVIIALWAVRSALRSLEPAKLDALWTGSPEGLDALRRLMRLPSS